MKKSYVINSVKDDEWMVLDNENGIMAVFDNDLARDPGMKVIKRLYVIQPDKNTVIELNVDEMVERLTDALLHTINTKELLTKVLQQTPPPDLIKAAKIIKDHPEVAKQAKTRDGCFYIDLPDPSPGSDAVPLYIRL